MAEIWEYPVFCSQINTKLPSGIENQFQNKIWLFLYYISNSGYMFLMKNVNWQPSGLYSCIVTLGES
jgi:hypothetical protein